MNLCELIRGHEMDLKDELRLMRSMQQNPPESMWQAGLPDFKFRINHFIFFAVFKF